MTSPLAIAVFGAVADGAGDVGTAVGPQVSSRASATTDTAFRTITTSTTSAAGGSLAEVHAPPRPRAARFFQACVTALLVLARPAARAPAEGAVVPGGAKAPPLGRRTKSGDAHIAVGQGLKGDQPDASGNGRKKEPHEAIQHSSRDLLSQWCVVTAVGSGKRLEISGTLAFLDHGWRITKPHQKKIHQQSASAAVSIDEWVHPLEARMQLRESLAEETVPF